MDTRLGKQHPILRRVRELRRDAALRQRERVFLAEGPHLAEEALASPEQIERVLYSERLLTDAAGRTLFQRVAQAGVPHAEVADTVLATLQDARSPQPILTVAHRREPNMADALGAAGSSALCVVVHGVQDPGNLGSLWRTSDAAGAALFVVTGDGVDLYHPRAVRATMGSVFRLDAVRADLPETLAALTAAGLPTVATTAAATTDYHAADLSGGCAVFLGGEGGGLPEHVLAATAVQVRIPMRLGVESLSVGAAAAVILFEAARQRAGRGIPRPER